MICSQKYRTSWCSSSGVRHSISVSSPPALLSASLPFWFAAGVPAADEVADRCAPRDFRSADRTRSLAFAFVVARRDCKDVSV